jgi:hypothetical protein
VDREGFDRLSRLVAAAGTRRAALRLLVAGAVGAAGGMGAAEARKRRKRGRVRAEQVLNCTDRGCVSCANRKIGPGANLTRCDLNRRFDLGGLNLGGSNLTKACLGDANLQGVRFRGANVSGACFCGSDLRGADFRGTRVTEEQLACARVLGCDTILPTGKKAIVCEADETCCAGVCVSTGSDPNNCGACGNVCDACQFCDFGVCVNLADGQFDCGRVPLERIEPGTVCSVTPGSGVCAGGVCLCGDDGIYDADTNSCGCGERARNQCAAAGCCDVDNVCVEESGQVLTLFSCRNCP